MAGAGTHSGKARGRPRSADTDRLILDAALKLLSERGYARMSMDAVATEAGVSKPTIYLRYPARPNWPPPRWPPTTAAPPPSPRGTCAPTCWRSCATSAAAWSGPSASTMIGNLLAEEQQTPALLDGFREPAPSGPRRRQLRGILERAVADGRCARTPISTPP